MSYEDVDVILCCFAMDNPVSLKNIQNKWFPEIRSHCPDNPVVICGTKSDLDDIIAEEEVKKVMTATGSVSYVFCSAKMAKNLGKVFDEAIKAFFSK